MRFGSLCVQFHRTVRVPEGRSPAQLPPNLGVMDFEPVKKYKTNCPSDWEPEGYFAALHETEAMWMSFAPINPVAVLVGAGGINALTGEKLGTKLEKGNYLVAPPQPWLDGWKDKDGTVYQFVATAHKAGDGNTVGEQLIGKESKTGALAFAVFDPRLGAKLKTVHEPAHSALMSMFSDTTIGGGGVSSTMGSFGAGAGASTVMDWGSDNLVKFASPNFGATGMSVSCNTMTTSLMPSSSGPKVFRHSAARGSSLKLRAASGPRKPLNPALALPEMGIGKGGKIEQKIYEDPHGLDVWKTKPTRAGVIYLVNAEVFAEITGIEVPKPVGHEHYKGVWFGMHDKDLKDVPGTDKFSGLKSALPAFPGDTSNVTDDEWEEVPTSA